MWSHARIQICKDTPILCAEGVTVLFLNFWTFAATLGKRCFLLERTWRFASKQRTPEVLTSLSNGPENAAFTAHQWKQGTFIGHTMSVITDQYEKAKKALNFYPKFPFSHSLALTCPSAAPKKHGYCFVIRWWIIGGNVKLLLNWDFPICLYLPSLWLYVYSEGGMEGSEGEEMRDHRVCRILSAFLHFISPSVFIFLPLKWSE